MVQWGNLDHRDPLKFMNYKKPGENYIDLKKAARISGYSSDYIGWLIRKKKIKGKKVFTNISWQIPLKEIVEYCRENKSLEIQTPRSLAKKYLSLKEAAKISGYVPDYIGYLIRKRKISGKKTYSGIWKTIQSSLLSNWRQNRFFL